MSTLPGEELSPAKIGTPRSPVSQRGGRLRVRLIIGFLAVAMLPFLGISFITVVSGSQSGRETAIRQLNTVLNYKQSAILIWSEGLKAELGNVLLSESTAGSAQNLRLLLLAEDPRSPENEPVRNAVREHFHFQLGQSQYYDELIILGIDGIVLVSSNIAREGQPAGNLQVAFEQGLSAPFLAPPMYNEASQRTEIFVSYPIILQGTTTQGVLVGRAYINVLNNILGETSGLGATGKTYLVALDSPSDTTGAAINQTAGTVALRVLAGLSREEQGSIFESQTLAELASKASSGESPANAPGDTAALKPVEYAGDDLRGESVFGSYLYMSALDAFLLGEQSQAETNRSSLAVIAINTSVAISSILIALFLALQITRSIAAPLSELSEIAGEAAVNASVSQTADNQPVRSAYLPVAERLKTFNENWLEGGIVESLPAAPTEEELPATQDEIGQLAGAFSSMTAALSSLVEGLEARVDNRTAELQQRSSYLQASSEVSRATASILDPEELIQRSVGVIGEYFRLYYVGLFLLDETNQWAVLRAGTGEAGRKMLQRRHRLPVGRAAGASMIGWCVANAQPRIAQIAEEDVVRQANPDLPETRSEAAIPLRSRGRVIGAISVQSEQFNAFDETALAVLQSMADQLAVAIDNANLFAQSQEALHAERRAYSIQAQNAWAAWLGAQKGSRAYSYRATPAGATRADMVWYPEMDQAFSQGIPISVDAQLAAISTSTSQAYTPAGDAALPASSPEETQAPAAALAIPITVRGATIGALHLRRDPGDQSAWTHEDIAFLEGIAEQLAIALDSARLYAETQSKAEQERLIANLTSRIRASLDVETVIKTAADEIFTTLNHPDIPMESIIVELAPPAEQNPAASPSTVSSAAFFKEPPPSDSHHPDGGQDV